MGPAVVSSISVSCLALFLSRSVSGRFHLATLPRCCPAALHVEDECLQPVSLPAPRHSTTFHVVILFPWCTAGWRPLAQQTIIRPAKQASAHCPHRAADGCEAVYWRHAQSMA